MIDATAVVSGAFIISIRELHWTALRAEEVKFHKVFVLEHLVMPT